MFPQVPSQLKVVASVAEAQFEQGNLPEWVFNAFRSGAYFQFGEHSVDLPDERIFKEGCQAISEGFFTPFHTTIVEDTEAIVIVQDTIKDQEGLQGKRLFVTAGLKQDESPKNRSAVISWGEFDKGAFSFGRDGKEKERVPLHATVGLMGSFLADRKRIQSEIVDEEGALGMLPMQHGLICGALKEIAYFNMPGKFVVEEAPRKQAKGRRKIKWGKERPRFTMLSPEQIRILFQEPELDAEASEGAELVRSPHPRRRHRRTYRHQRFERSGLQGHSIIIPATWVGPTEKRVGDKLYRVRLDV